MITKQRIAQTAPKKPQFFYSQKMTHYTVDLVAPGRRLKKIDLFSLFVASKGIKSKIV